MVVWNYNRPWEELRELLWRADDLSLPRETIDLSSPNAVIYFGRALTGRKNKEGQGTFECFAWRSGDRGQTWEQVPTRVSPPSGMNYVHIDGGPLAKFDDGTQLAVASIGGDDSDTGLPESVNSGLGVYGTDDNGRRSRREPGEADAGGQLMIEDWHTDREIGTMAAASTRSRGANPTGAVSRRGCQSVSQRNTCRCVPAALPPVRIRRERGRPTPEAG